MGNSIDHGLFRKYVLLAFGLSFSISGFAFATSGEPTAEQQVQSVKDAKKINPAAVEVLPWPEPPDDVRFLRGQRFPAFPG